MFSRVGEIAYKKDIGNIRELLAAIGNPHYQFKSIHIAGTNGKGSTSHMLAAILQQHGYTTGLYTSPHLRDFRERIKVNGDMCSHDFVIDFTAKLMPIIESIEPSFFEVTVAMAFAWFAQEKVEVAVIETGLGGRLDSTNIILPELSIITNIAMDHMNILGDTLEKIAAEKAGIIKENIPVIIGQMHPETTHVFVDTAAAKNAPIYFAEELYTIKDAAIGIESLRLAVEKTDGEEVLLTTDLPGIYQQHNVLTVYAASKQLQQQGWPITDENIVHGIAKAASLTGLHGRWELLHRKPWIVADVAHNSDGIEQLFHHIAMLSSEVSAVHIIYGTSADKDTDGIFPFMPKDYAYYFTKANLPRAMDEQLLSTLAANAGLHGKTFGDVNSALQSAIASASKNDLIVVCGSVFLVGEIDLTVIQSLPVQDA